MSKTLRSSAHLALMQVLVEQRKAQGFTQTQLAEALNRPQSFIAKIETGERRLDVIEFAEFVLALDVEPEFFLKPVLTALLER